MESGRSRPPAGEVRVLAVIFNTTGARQRLAALSHVLKHGIRGLDGVIVRFFQRIICADGARNVGEYHAGCGILIALLNSNWIFHAAPPMVAF